MDKWCIFYNIFINSDQWITPWFSRKETKTPYLFPLLMEVFIWMMKRDESGGPTSGWKIGAKGEEGKAISHLLFVGGTVVFCDATRSNLKHLTWIPMWFETMLALRMNLHRVSFHGGRSCQWGKASWSNGMLEG